MTVLDTVFNRSMRPVFVGEPERVRQRLKAEHPEDWTRVCVGETQSIVTVSEYLHKEKWDEVVAVINDLAERANKPLYKRDPDRLKSYIQRAARQIFDIIEDDK